MKRILFFIGLIASIGFVQARDIAVIGWGSLIWNPKRLAISEDFQLGGPRLPIAFSRISGDKRLTLVIDKKSDAVPHGEDRRKPENVGGNTVTTWYAPFEHTDLSKAIKDLRVREGIDEDKADRIGYVNLNTRKFRIRQISPVTGREVSIKGDITTVSPNRDAVRIADGTGIRKELVPVLKEIIAWTQRKGFKGAVWTDLQSNFRQKTGHWFSEAQGSRYIWNLSDQEDQPVLEYIYKAPIRNQTKLGPRLNISGYRLR